MALDSGSVKADSGMAKAIYDTMAKELGKDLPALSENERNKLHDSWKKLAYCIAAGVVDHIENNLEIVGAPPDEGKVTVTIQGNQGTGKIKVE